MICFHPRRRKGPRVEAVYGTVPTEVCEDCGDWSTSHGEGRWWRKAADLEAEVAEQERRR